MGLELRIPYVSMMFSETESSSLGLLYRDQSGVRLSKQSLHADYLQRHRR